MAEATDVVVHLHDLAIDRVRIPGEDETVLHERPERGILEHLEDARVRSLHRIHRRRGRVIAGRAGELRRDLVGLQVPHQLARAGVTLLVGLADVDQRRVGEAIERRRGQSQLGAPLAIRAEHVLRAVEAGQEAGDDVALLADGPRTARAERGDPDRRVRLLVRPWPDVHLPVVEVLALPVEGAVVARPRLHDQIVGLPEALHHAGRPVVAGRHLVRDAAHEPALQAAARVDVDHRHLLGHAHGLAPVRDRIAEDQEARLAGVARERAHDDRGRRVQVGRRLVVLVHHDLETEVLGDLPLVDEAVIEVGADLRVVVAIGELHADRVVLLGIGQEVIRVLAEEPGTHAHRRPPTPWALRGIRGRARRTPRAPRYGGSARPHRSSRTGLPESRCDRLRRSTPR